MTVAMQSIEYVDGSKGNVLQEVEEVGLQEIKGNVFGRLRIITVL